jgi:hypothetical protein
MINPSHLYLEQRPTPLIVMLILFLPKNKDGDHCCEPEKKSAKRVIHLVFFLQNYRNCTLEYSLHCVRDANCNGRERFKL